MSDSRNIVKSICGFFFICAIFDFLWGYIKEHSLVAGVAGVIGGLLSSAFFAFFLWAGLKEKEKEEGKK